MYVLPPHPTVEPTHTASDLESGLIFFNFTDNCLIKASWDLIVPARAQGPRTGEVVGDAVMEGGNGTAWFTAPLIPGASLRFDFLSYLVCQGHSPFPSF